MSIIDLHNYLENSYDIPALVIHPIAENEYSKYIYNSFPEEIVQDYIENINKMAFDYGKFLSNHADAHCSLGVNILNVNSDGPIYPCYTLTNKNEFLMGKIQETNVLENKKFKNVQLKFINNTKSENPICCQCDIAKVCSACPGMMVAKHNKIDMPVDTYCNYSVGLIEGLLTGIYEIMGQDEKWNRLVTMHQS